MTRPALLFADEPTGNLDYTTGTEILDALWRSCVERHQTVVLVTHDSKAAAYADRVLVISDGRIARRDRARRREVHDATPLITRLAELGSSMGGLTSLAWRSLAARRGRTALSVVGIALGVGVLFASLATDAGIEASIDRTVRDLVGRADLRVAAFGDAGLSAESVAAIEEAPGVVVAAPVLERRTYLESGIDDPNVAAAPVTDPRRRPDRSRRRSDDLPLVAGSAARRTGGVQVLVTERLAARGRTAASAPTSRSRPAPRARSRSRSSASSRATGRSSARAAGRSSSRCGRRSGCSARTASAGSTSSSARARRPARSRTPSRSP